MDIKSIISSFKEFAVRGNLIDMAVGIVVGGAFGTIAKSLVNDIIMPPVGLVLGSVDFEDLFWVLDDSGPYQSLQLAQEAGAPTINYGLFINNVLAFLIVALAMFFIVRTVNRLKDMEDEEPSAPTKRNCPYCYSTISVKANRCPQCTSEVEPQVEPAGA
ncbi:MAG: large-conductance mechanosensitive channel protein MscL [Anaerolineae bacterium]|nr:large-conductance mechanosensitive channel protein MscL [Anaerolineae bacterium]